MPPASRKRTASQGPRSGADIATDGATDGATDRNSRREQRTTRGQSPSSTSPALLSDVWLLRARPFDGDVRSKEATELRAYLVAGRTYVVGSSAKVADVIVKEDKTVSRTHATLRVVARGEETIGEKKTRSTGSKRSKRSKRSNRSKRSKRSERRTRRWKRKRKKSGAGRDGWEEAGIRKNIDEKEVLKFA